MGGRAFQMVSYVWKGDSRVEQTSLLWSLARKAKPGDLLFHGRMFVCGV
jgi:hypothetical protein